jgi:hypothetical protein
MYTIAQVWLRRSNGYFILEYRVKAVGKEYYQTVLFCCLPGFHLSSAVAICRRNFVDIDDNAARQVTVLEHSNPEASSIDHQHVS